MALAALSAPKGRISYLQAALGAVALITALRYLVLAGSGLDLYGDEAQYWAWSQSLAFGYFTKPPLVAWIIRAASAVCGDGEACVRAASPRLHGATALVLYALARRLYDSRIAFWTAVAYATLPAVSLSSLLISTDVPLIFFWSAALLFLLRTIESREAKMAAAAGIAIDIGAMVDASIILIENVHKKLVEWDRGGRTTARVDAIVHAMQEVGPSVFFSLLVITVAFIPVFTLEGVEGRLFKPLAFTKTYSMGFAAILSITLTPALGSPVMSNRPAFVAGSAIDAGVPAVTVPKTFAGAVPSVPVPTKRSAVSEPAATSTVWSGTW